MTTRTGVPVMVPAHHLRRPRQGSHALTHAAQGDTMIRDILKRMRHDGCGRRPGRFELLTCIEAASSRPVRNIVPRSD